MSRCEYELVCNDGKPNKLARVLQAAGLGSMEATYSGRI